MKNLVCLFGMAAALAACGGGSEAPAAPGGLYVGYYAEDPATNPEDPTAGAFTLNLPAGNAAFSGSMYFTYVGCQTSNVGAVSGSKAALSLSGVWSGTVDGLPQSGSYAGAYNTATGSYAGTYGNAGGKQYRDLRPCIEYWIGPSGSWEMFALEARVPASFDVAVSGRTVSWPAPPGAARTLVYLLDPAVAQAAGNPVLWQTAGPGSATSAAVPPAVALQPARQYLAVVAAFDAAGERVAFGSRRFNAP